MSEELEKTIRDYEEAMTEYSKFVLIKPLADETPKPIDTGAMKIASGRLMNAIGRLNEARGVIPHK